MLAAAAAIAALFAACDAPAAFPPPPAALAFLPGAAIGTQTSRAFSKIPLTAVLEDGLK